MRTFLDDNLIYGSTFLLYGNVNDQFYCSDAEVRKLDQYLNALLKKMGYEHIIFFGTGGTRGAYCLDAESARYFFNANQGVPAVEALQAAEHDGSDGNQQPDPPSSRGGVGARIRRGRRKRGTGYTPGSLSAGQPTEPAPEPVGTQQAGAAPVRIQYALRKLSIGSFYTQFRDKLLDPNSRMAMIFYNVLTDVGNRDSIFLPSLKDDILSNFSQTGDRNLCLIVAPDTMRNTKDLQNLLQMNGMGGKFLIPVPPYDYVFNQECCFQLGYPGVDEIKNMLHRFALIGTSRYKRISLNYSKMEELAERILSNATLSAQRQNKPELRKMRVIASRMEGYIHSHARVRGTVEITPDVIDDIWDVHPDPEQALDKLSRRGWEDAYDKVMRALRSAKNAVRNLDAQTEPAEHIPELSLERFAQTVAVKGGPRPPVPNFVLLGSPGTGKTVIARLIGQILCDEGILKIGHTVEVTRENLTSSFVAGVPKATMAQVDKAEEGVLFIDEAHSLGRKDGGQDHEGTGVEVVSTLNAAITDPNRHFCTILAGYPNEMQKVFDLDPGFAGRFHVTINLDDYQPDLLCTILRDKILSLGYTIDPPLLQEQLGEDDRPYVPLQAMVDRIYAERDREKFRNADAMVKLAEHATGMSDGDDRIIRQENFYGGMMGKITAEYFVPMNLGMTKEKIFATMDQEYVGMENVKAVLRSMALSIERTLAEGGSVDSIALDPIVLVGNPGAGKTVVANTLAQLYYYYGLVGTPEPLVRNASSIVSPYQGDTSCVTEAIKKAQDQKGFLFVDEAHNLNEQALKAFMAPLTDRKHPFVACFAVYESDKEKFLSLDPGSRSRFEKNMIHLEDYKPDEMYEIFVRAMTKKGYSADDKTLALVKELMRREYDTRTVHTGNARHVLNILDKMFIELDLRCSRDGIPFGTPESRCFIETDIPESYRKGLRVNDAKSRIAELDELEQEIRNHRTGNQGLKEIMLGLLDGFRFKTRFPKLAPDFIEPGHYFFMGNAGTGKTTSLNYLGEVLFRLGITRDPTPVLLSASRLVGQYLGQTAVQTRELLENHMGRLIMIDEAYALTDANKGAGSYKRDAVNEIVAKLDDPVFRKTTCVVFAGYEEDMAALYRENQGLKSRVMEVRFPDFTQDDCIKILCQMLEDRQAPLVGEAQAQCAAQIAYMRRLPAFSNGRTLRKYADSLVSRRNSRMLAASDDETQQPEFANIQPHDIPLTENLEAILNL